MKCLELIDSIKTVRLQQQAQALQDLEKEEPPPPPDLSDLDAHEKELTSQVQALLAAKSQLETAQQAIQPLLKQYREEWHVFRQKIDKESVEGLEEVLGIKLKENEIEQLHQVES